MPKRMQKKSRLDPLRTKNFRLPAKKSKLAPHFVSELRTKDFSLRLLHLFFGSPAQVVCIFQTIKNSQLAINYNGALPHTPHLFEPLHETALLSSLLNKSHLKIKQKSHIKLISLWNLQSKSLLFADFKSTINQKKVINFL